MADINNSLGGMSFKHGAAIQTASADDIDLASAKIIVGNSSGNGVAVDLSRDATISNTGAITLTNGTYFSSTTSVGTAAISAGTVTLLADSVVTGSRSVYVLGWYVQNNATAWVTGGGGTFTIKNSGATGTTFFSFGTATVLETANAFTSFGSPSAYTPNTPITFGGGGAASKGLVITNTGTTTSGDLFRITVFGLIK